MDFAWSETKRTRNLDQHGFDFVDAATVFAGPTVTYVGDRFDYAEERLVTLGLLDGMVVSIAHTESAELIRVISMRKASKHEQAIFFNSLQDGLATRPCVGRS
jgi:uncharacterized protein